MSFNMSIQSDSITLVNLGTVPYFAFACWGLSPDKMATISLASLELMFFLMKAALCQCKIDFSLDIILFCSALLIFLCCGFFK